LRSSRFKKAVDVGRLFFFGRSCIEVFQGLNKWWSWTEKGAIILLRFSQWLSMRLSLTFEESAGDSKTEISNERRSKKSPGQKWVSRQSVSCREWQEEEMKESYSSMYPFP
jgi:hypothetical protein